MFSFARKNGKKLTDTRTKSVLAAANAAPKGVVTGDLIRNKKANAITSAEETKK